MTKITNKGRFIFLMIILTFLSLGNKVQAKPSKLTAAVDKYLSIKPSEAAPELPHVGIGSMDGCLLDEEFWEIYFHLKLKYSQYISDFERFGHTFEKRHMTGFWFETQSPDRKNFIPNKPKLTSVTQKTKKIKM